MALYPGFSMHMIPIPSLHNRAPTNVLIYNMLKTIMVQFVTENKFLDTSAHKASLPDILL